MPYVGRILRPSCTFLKTIFNICFFANCCSSDWERWLRGVPAGPRMISNLRDVDGSGSGCSKSKMAQLRKKIKTHADAVLHALRSMFLTEAGEYTDPFTLQYVAGHDNIMTTMLRGTHAKRRLRNCLCGSEIWSGRRGRVECKRSVQNPVQSERP